MSLKLQELKGNRKCCFYQSSETTTCNFGILANLGEASPAELAQLIRLSKANDINLRSLKKRRVPSRRQIHGLRIVTATSLSSLSLIYPFVVVVV